MTATLDEIKKFCSRKGFAYQSSEIYGGIAGFYDYGHLGTILKRNFEDLWRQYFLSLDDNFFEIETSEIMHKQVFVASGHIKNFNDATAKCSKGHIERADHLLEEKMEKRFEGLSVEELHKEIKDNKIKCPICGEPIEKVEMMNLMFPLTLGVEKVTEAYLRPETAQSPYVNFKRQLEVMRRKMPLGLALIGKAYRNEISPRNFILRQRGFTQAELQIFFNPSRINEHKNFDEIKDYALRVMFSDKRAEGIRDINCSLLTEQLPKFYVYHMAKVQQFYMDILKIPKDKFRLYQLNDKEKAFYNKYHFDIELNLDMIGWTEVGGIHYRTDHDLKGHQEVSKENMECVDNQTNEKFVPHILELSFGVDRNFYSIINFAYDDDKERGNIVLKLDRKVSPFEIAIFPLLSNRPEIVAKASEVHNLLREKFRTFFDSSGSIGRRYARQDEIGTPYCITIDFDSLENDDVTIRYRDSTHQRRVKIKDLIKELSKN